MNSNIFPTIIQKLDDYLYIKRDDLLPFSFGGNKARKAKYFFEEIDNGDYDSVVTYGSSSSNHCRVVANMAASRNIPCYIISPEETIKETYNRRMMNMFGAKIILAKTDDVEENISNVLNKISKKGGKPFFIQGGGHGNLGTKAYVDCYDEIKKFEKNNDVYFDYIFFASGTGTTQAGLVCGQIINNDDRKIIGISIARNQQRGRQIIIDSIDDYLKTIGVQVGKEKIEEKTIFEDEFTDGGYGITNKMIDNTISDVLVKYGIPLDSTYTGKAFYGMTKYIESKNIREKNILFIHTGGTPLFFNDIERIKI